MKEYKYDGKGSFSIKSHSTRAADTDDKFRQSVEEKYIKNLDLLMSYQEKLYAQGKEGVIIILQATDGAGKDSTIKSVMGAFNPQGVRVHSFKSPNSEELSHDFLWRANNAIAPRGYISIFNRSYYEDVLIVKVRRLYKNYAMPKRCLGENIIENRYRQIRNYESYLYGNGYRIIKLFLNLSKEEQKERFLERIERKEKNWKLSVSDVGERALWNEYQDAFESMIRETSTEENPWYIVPADHKWFTRYIVSEITLDVFKDINPEFPKVTGEQEDDIEESYNLLMSEKD